MADLEQLIEQFKADHEAGRPVDVLDFVDQVPVEERQELADKLDMYLMDAPRRRWDPAAYEGSPAQAAVERVHESIEGVSGSWPELLPQLRNGARIKRSELVGRLAAKLGFEGEPQVEKIGAYYHQMEHGSLPATGVSGRVIEALAAIVGSTAETIRAAGASRGDEIVADAAFARMASLDTDFLEERTAEDLDVALDAAPADGPKRDEIDALFLDG